MCIRDRTITVIIRDKEGHHRGMHTINKKIIVEPWGGNVQNAWARITSVEIFVTGVENQGRISEAGISHRITTCIREAEMTARKHQGAMEFISSMRKGTGRAVPPPEPVSYTHLNLPQL